MTVEKNNPRVMFGWAMYDWANSVYNLVITSAIFPIFYGIQTSSVDKITGKLIDTVSFSVTNYLIQFYIIMFFFGLFNSCIYGSFTKWGG